MKRSRPTVLLLTATVSVVMALAVALPAWAETDTGGSEPSGTTAGETETATTSDQPKTETSPSAADADATRSTAEESDGTLTTAAGGRRFGDRTLRRGDRGRDVRRLQKVLRHLNFKVKVTRRFDGATKRQVRRYDIWKEKKVNGVVHPKQAKRMKRLERRGAQYRRHFFPVRGPHSYGSEGSRFGAPRSGRTHQGQDVAAASGTKLVAAHEGIVAYRQYQDGGAGHYLVIHGKDGSDSVYMHMLKRPRVAPGERVLAGTKIGRVGSTGSSTGPHLHFELWTRHWFDGGSAFDPLDRLLKWDRRT